MARIFKPGGAKRASSESTPSLLQIESLSQDGRGVARHEGKTVFVDGGLPGEEVEVSHYRRQKRFSECQAKQITSASSDRIEPVCPVFSECGGCQLQHLQPNKQLLLKQQALLASLQRQHNLKPEKLVEPIHSPSEGYRNRVRFGIDRNQCLSFRRKQSDQLVAIKTCPVLHPALDALISPLQAWLDDLPAKSGVTHVEMIQALDENGGDQSVLVVRHIKPLDSVHRESLQSQLAEVSCWFQGKKNGELTDAGQQPVDDELYLRLDAESLSLAFQPGDFTQVNDAVNQQMVVQAMDWLQPSREDRIADLFCGMGNFSLAIARRAGRVLGIEGSEAMVQRAAANAERNRLKNTEFVALNLESAQLLNRLNQQGINKLLLDPPRAGAKAVCEQLASSQMERIVYVSCNPASFARDAAVLVAAGYSLASLRSMDMFPHTSHMETMALFVHASDGQ